MIQSLNGGKKVASGKGVGMILGSVRYNSKIKFMRNNLICAEPVMSRLVTSTFDLSLVQIE